MSDIAINPVTRRVQFTGNTGTGPFAFGFNILTSSDIVVFKGTTKLTLSTNYSVSISANGTGTVSLGSALISSDVLTIIGGRLLSRTTDFVTAGDLLASSLNEQLDSNVIMTQQLDEKQSRTLFLNPGDVFTDLELPLKDARKGKVLSFNSSSGDPEVTQQLTGAAVNVSAVSAGGNATGSVAVSGGTATFALGIPTGATGLTGATGQAGGGLANIVSDTTPQLGGNLDMNGKDIVTVSNATIDLAPNGTGTVVVRGNTNSGAVVFNCESNSHGQKVFGQPHSASVTNTLMLPAGANSTLLSRVSIDTLTNKTLTSPKINENVTLTSTATELNIMDGVTSTTAEINLIDGGTARGTTAVADGDGVLINDAGTMRMTKVDTLATYIGTKVGGGGKVLQVINVLDSTARSASGGQKAIAVQASITPSSTSSKIVMFGSSALQYTGGAEIKMYRQYGASDQGQLGEDQYFAPNSAQSRRLYPFHFYDSPNTTSARSYTVIMEAGGTVYTNYNNSQSVMFLMEIDNA